MAIATPADILLVLVLLLLQTIAVGVGSGISAHIAGLSSDNGGVQTRLLHYIGSLLLV